MIFAGFPLKYFLYLGLFLLVVEIGMLVLYFMGVLQQFRIYGELFVLFFILVSICILVSLAIISKYISKLFLQTLGKPEYLIIEER